MTAVELLEIARIIAIDAGKLAETMRADGISVASTKSSRLDIVTQADTAVESLIRRRLHELRPDDGFFGEESGEGRGDSGITWIVDPIDGTVNYLYGSPHYAVSIAAVLARRDGTATTLAGVVHAPAVDVTYLAAAGHGATRNGEGLRVNDDVELDSALVSTGMMYDVSSRPRVLEDITNLALRIRDFRFGGSAALDICAVADGRTDAYFHRGLPVWDYAAATLIAEEAGAGVRGAVAGAAAAELLLVAGANLADRLERLLTHPTTEGT